MTRPSGFLTALALVLSATLLAAAAPQAGSDAKASGSVTVMVNGPRQGESGRTFLNIEGRANGKEGIYACFGVVEFHAAKPQKPVSRVESLTLKLVQSIPAFAKDGPIGFELVADSEPLAELKFDKAEVDGLAGQLKPRHKIGGGAFKKVKTGAVETFQIEVAGGEAEAMLRKQVNAGGTIRLAIVPGDEAVAATYFGAGQADAEKRPALSITAAP